MSRNYLVNIVIAPLDDDELEKTTLTLNGLGFQTEKDAAWTDSIINQDDVEEDGWCFPGQINLAGGIDEQSMHVEIVSAFPEKCVTSRWKYVDFDEWDDVYEYYPGDYADE